MKWLIWKNPEGGADCGFRSFRGVNYLSGANGNRMTQLSDIMKTRTLVSREGNKGYVVWSNANFIRYNSWD